MKLNCNLSTKYPTFLMPTNIKYFQTFNKVTLCDYCRKLFILVLVLYLFYNSDGVKKHR